MVERPRETTTDNDIFSYQWLLIDAPRVRSSGVSASRKEKGAARQVAGTTTKRLITMDLCDPLVTDSSLATTYSSEFTQERRKTGSGGFPDCPRHVFSTEQVKIDTTVLTPARTPKQYGTVCRKGASTPERPPPL